MRLKQSLTTAQLKALRNSKPRIPGFKDHPNRSDENLKFLMSLPAATANANQRYFTKTISDFDMNLYWEMLALKKILTYSNKDLLYFAYELKCNIGMFTLSNFLSIKWGPAFRVKKKSRESLCAILGKLKNEYFERHGKEFHLNESGFPGSKKPKTTKTQNKKQ